MTKSLGTERPCHRPRAAFRRGSALIIVLGALALLSVFAAIYLSIGRADRSTARATQLRVERGQIAEEVAGYVAGVIGEDRLDVFAEPRAPGLAPLTTTYRREAFDYPSTDYSVRSQLPATDSNREAVLFRPTGGHPTPWLGGGADQRVPSDPWLSSTEPEWLGDPRSRPSVAAGFSENNPARLFLDNRDWRQISNLAEDGLFVNLFNLRSQLNPLAPGGGALGGFDSQPGIGTYTDADNRTRSRMTNGLTLLDVRPADGRLRSLGAVAQAWLPGQNTPTPMGVTYEELLNIPAAWTMHQRFLFFPANQPFFIYDSAGQIADWSSPEYPAYQFTDADGDGMHDSRWFELADASDPDAIRRLVGSDDYRVFAAVRVEDLSARVNVNTATDQVAPGTLEEPWGVTPAEVDLRRLLTMADQALEHRASPAPTATLGLSFAEIDQPTEPNNARLPGDPVSNYLRRGQFVPSNFTGYLGFGALTPADANIASEYSAETIGRAAYDAVRLAIVTGELPDTNATLDPAAPLAGVLTRDSLVTDSPFARPLDLTTGQRASRAANTPEDWADARADAYDDFGRLDITASLVRQDRLTISATDPAGALFDLEDLAELLTFNGINDPAVTSRLERAVQGRVSNGSLTVRESSRRLDPLLTNRPLDLDRFGHGDGRRSQFPDPYRGPNAGWPLVTGKIDEESLALFALSPRARLTTWNAAEPLVSAPVRPLLGVFPGITSAERAAGANASASSLFTAFAGALASDSGGLPPKSNNTDRGVWRKNLDPSAPTTADIVRTMTLFYGYDGPELALRLAAHLAVNAADALDDDTEPTPATLLVDNGALEILADNEPAELSNPTRAELEDLLHPAWHFESRLDLGESDENRLPGRRGSSSAGGNNGQGPSSVIGGVPWLDDEERRAVTVFGSEPTPVLTEVATLVVYTDRPDSAGGDSDGGNWVPPPGTPTPSDITIEHDPIVEVLAFQIYNPSDSAISLSRPRDFTSLAAATVANNGDLFLRDELVAGPPQRELFDYYIEYGGRFYRLADYAESRVDAATNTWIQTAPGERYRDAVIGARESRTFYIVADDNIDTTDADWLDIFNDYGVAFSTTDPFTGPAKDWLQDQFRGQGSAAPVLVREFDPRTGADILDPGRNFFAVRPGIPATGPSVETPTVPALPPVALANRASTQTVRLWKRFVLPNEHADPASAPQTPDRRFNENLLANDILVDRLDLGAPDRLDARLFVGAAGSATAVQGSVGYEESFDSVLTCTAATGSRIPRNDNSGFTIARWASVRRADPAGVVSTPPLRGETPAWLLAPRNGSLNQLSRAENAGSFPDLATLNITDFVSVCNAAEPISGPTTQVRAGSDFEITPSLRALYQHGSQRRIIRTIGNQPWLKLAGLGYDGSPSSIADDDNNTREKFPSNAIVAGVDGTLNPTSVTGLRPLLIANSLSDTEARPADLLLLPAVGAVHAPDLTRSTASNTSAGLDFDVDAEWLTAPEALAIALGYDTPAYSTGPTDQPQRRITDVYASLARASRTGPATGQPKLTLDSAALRLDAFVPFLDASAGTADDRFFDPAAGDVVRGDGVPVALGLLDRFDPVERVKRLSAATAGVSDDAVVGRININTAPPSVLRLLPGLSPSFESFRPDGPSSGGTTVSEYWPDDFSVGIPAPTTTEPKPDTAAVLAAYRDRGLTMPRRLSDPDQDPIGTPSAWDYRPGAASGTPITTPADLARLYLTNFWSEDALALNAVDRGLYAEVPGLRGTPGFRSRGEVLAAVGPRSTTSALLNGERWQGMDRLARDNDSFEVDSDKATAGSLRYSGDETDGLQDDRSEEFALANAILNSVSVRSDSFAVWMVVHGYRPSDVEGLQPGDPLVPSFAKRYLMVIDRSNVTDAGQAPRILAFREVPM